MMQSREALTNVAMQIATMNPQYLSRNDMSADELAKLREITEKSALNDPASSKANLKQVN